MWPSLSSGDQAINKPSMRIIELKQGERDRAGGKKEGNQSPDLMENYPGESYS